MRGVEAALDNLLSVLVTRDLLRLADGTTELRHRTDCWDETDLEDDPTRTCAIFLMGDRLESGELLAARDPGAIDTSVDVAVAYQAGTDAWSLQRLIAEDVDLLSNRLALPSLWDSEASGITDRAVTGFSLQRPSSAGKAAILILSVGFAYMPEYV